ncbi:MAG: alpha/beta hydrolase [Clostridia bacterium]|nr:alpha/beta hydrolase [Clostridia bacterium]
MIITIALVFLITLLLVSGYFFLFACYRKPLFGSKKIGETPNLTGYQMERLLDDIEWLEAQNIETVHYYARKVVSLSARLIRNKNSKKIAVLVHGYRSTPQKFACIARHYFEELGYSLLLPDQRAHGESDGRFITFGYEESTDMFFWARYIQHTFGSDVKIVYHGVSMGAATVAMMPEMHLPRCIKGLIVDCGYTSAKEIFQYILKKDFHIPKFLAIPVIKTVSLISETFADFPFDECEPVEAVKKAKIPMLFIHGKEDKFVPCEMGIEMYEACACNEKDLLLIEGAGHAVSHLTDSKTYEEGLDGFLSKVM